MSLKNKLLKTVKLSDSSVQQTTQIYKDTETISLKELKNIIKNMKAVGKKKHDDFDVYLVRVLNGANWITFKTDEDIDNYYDGKVKDAEKFKVFNQVELTTIYED